MKKERNCGNNYPIYPAYPIQTMIPGIQPMPLPNMTPNYYSNYDSNANAIEQINSLNNQINSLERRVANLENLIGGTANKYNTSNYQML